MTAVLVWLGLAWMIAIGIALWFWERIKPVSSEVWVPKNDKPGGLCPHCEEPWLTWAGPHWAKCLRCMAFVSTDMIMRLCREQECRNLTPSYKAIKQGLWCDYHHQLVELARKQRV